MKRALLWLPLHVVVTVIPIKDDFAPSVTVFKDWLMTTAWTLITTVYIISVSYSPLYLSSVHDDNYQTG